MQDNALYFPYISVPDNSWTIKALLYWDKLSSIVPTNYIDEPEKLGPFMQRLVQEQLVEQVFPSAYLYKIDNFEECFIRFISKQKRRLKKYSINSRYNQRSKIHIEKLGNIQEFLTKEGFASKINYLWYDVDSNVANLFMTYLASCLGSLDEINATPVTNQMQFSQMFGHFSYRNRKREFNSPTCANSRDVILDSLLPVPGEKVTLDQLLKFKSDYGHLLPPFRNKIENFCCSVSALSGENRKFAIEQFIIGCSENINEIEDAMKKTWGKVIFGSLVTVFGSGLSFMGGGIDNKLTFWGGALSLSGCIYQAINSIKTDIQKRPLAYVAHAKSQLINVN